MPTIQDISVGHEPRHLQLSHYGVNEWVDRLSRFPGLPRTDAISPDLPFCVVSRPSQLKDEIPVVDRAILGDQKVGSFAVIISFSYFLVCIGTSAKGQV